MLVHGNRAHPTSRGRWAMATALAAGIVLSAQAAFAADPHISGMNSDQFTTGSYITIYGDNFGPAMGQSYVLYGDRPVPIVFWSNQVITGVLPAHLFGTPLASGAKPELIVHVQPGNLQSNAMPVQIAVAPSTGGGTGTDTGSGATQPNAAQLQSLNDSLLAERLAAQFFNRNASKAYLTASVTNPGTTTPPPTTPTTGAVGPAQDTTATLNLDALRGMVGEIAQGHNTHVSQLEQALGTNAQAAPTFQDSSLDAPTLSQFLTMAQTIEDFAVGAHQGVIESLAAGSSPAAVGQSVLQTLTAIALDDGRFAGAIRGFRKLVSTGQGGDPNLPVTDGSGAVNTAITHDQVVAFTQAYLAGSSPTPGSGAGSPTNGSNPGGTNTGNNGSTTGSAGTAPTGSY